MTRPLLKDHLSHDELLRAVVDFENLDRVKIDHLNACPLCHDNLERLSQRFSTLGRLARELAPGPQRPFRLPVTSRFSRWGLWPLRAAGLAAIIILLFRWDGSGRTTQAPHEQIATPNYHYELEAAVDALLENALPPAFQALAAVADPPDSGDIFDWVIPPLDDENKVI